MNDASHMPWEYKLQMRSSLQPAMVLVLIKIWTLFGPFDPFGISFLLRLFSGLLSGLSIYLILKLYLPKFESKYSKNALVALSLLLWFIIYNNVRFSSENWCGSAFVIGFCVYFLSAPDDRKRYLWAGLLMGLSFLFRFQAGFLIAGFGMWILFVEKCKIRDFVVFSLAVVGMIGMGIVLDRWYYGEWTLTSWNFAYHNGATQNIYTYNERRPPFYYYFTDILLKGIPPFSLVFIVGPALAFYYRAKNIVTWIVLPFLVFHFIVAHKVDRFLFPIYPFVPILMVFGYEEAVKRYGRFDAWWKGKWGKVFVTGFWIANSLMMIRVCCFPAEGQMPLYSKLYFDYPEATTLYYLDDNPYKRTRLMHFYKRPALSFKQLDSLDDLPDSPPENSLIIITRQQDREILEQQYPLVYYNLPHWLREYNFFNWVDRTRFYYLFELGSR